MRRRFPFIILVVIFFVTAARVSGQTSDEVERRKATLENELKVVEEQIAAQTKLLRATEQQSASLERDRTLLNQQIARAKLVIKQHQLEIEQLGGDIKRKSGTISELGAKIETTRVSLAELLRKHREVEEVTVVELLLSDNTLANLTQTAVAYQNLGAAIDQSFVTMRLAKSNNEAAKVDLEGRQAAERAAQAAIASEQRLIERKEKEKRELLAITKNQAVGYKKVLEERQRRKTEIKSALFRLRGSDAITFGQAVEHASFISQKTGIRPALLLAIITQESNLGANVGTCNRPDNPPAKKWRAIMKPERDLQPFIRITQGLNLDPDIVPLSCPQAGGWGGAMGPAQFIPSTWELYQNKITAVTGNKPPNPWLPRDAFTASGIYLKELGATAGNFIAERTAALRYYAGSNWSAPRNAFYGNDVMKIAGEYQELINTLTD
ncbi:MAG: lytic murein transglycosylase [Patescibacteria group bacterium]